MRALRDRIMIFSAALVLLFSGSGYAQQPETYYTALGDSIPYGIGAADFYGYAHRFRDYLATLNSAGAHLNNQAIPGIDAGELHFGLRYDVPKGIRSGTRNADVITVSIGGNNLLPCASDNYNALDTECAAAGVERFAADWPRILDQIRVSIGARGKLLVMTIYNPFRGDDPNFATADTYIQQMNGIINKMSYRKSYKYRVAPVYSAFSGMFADGTWKTCAWTHFCELDRDVHPTDSGHQEIARIHSTIYP